MIALCKRGLQGGLFKSEGCKASRMKKAFILDGFFAMCMAEFFNLLIVMSKWGIHFLRGF